MRWCIHRQLSPPIFREHGPLGLGETLGGGVPISASARSEHRNIAPYTTAAMFDWKEAEVLLNKDEQEKRRAKVAAWKARATWLWLETGQTPPPLAHHHPPLPSTPPLPPPLPAEMEHRNLVHRPKEANTMTQRTRSRSPPRRRDYDRSRSPSRDRYRSERARRERTPVNGNDDYGRHAAPVSARSHEDRAQNKEQMMQSVRDASQQDRRVYVGNLSYDVKWHHLKDFMKEGTSHLKRHNDIPPDTNLLHSWRGPLRRRITPSQRDVKG